MNRKRTHVSLQITAAIFFAVILTGCEKPSLPPEGFAAQAVLSTNVVTVGDRVSLTLTARHPEGSLIRFPDVGSGKEVVVQGRSSDSRKAADGSLVSEEIYRLTSFRTGEWTVTTNPVICIFPDGTEKMQALPELILRVQSSLTETNATRLSDIKEIVKPPLRLSRKLWMPLLIILLALAAGLLTRLLLRNRNGKAEQSLPPVPAHLIARQALEALRKKPWMPEPFFTELSLILRAYLENRFSLNAPESTTEELTHLMTQDPRLKVGEQQTLYTFLTQADLVKFARADAEQEVMQTAFSTVEHFIDQTVPSDPANPS